MARRRGRRSFGQARRGLVWARELATISAFPGTANLLTDFLVDLGANAPLGSTVTRIVGDFGVTGVTGVGQLCLGIIKVQAGGLATLDPVNEQHADWMYWSAQPISATAADSINTRWHIDIKAQRKLQEVEEDLLLAAELVTATAATLHIATSVLIKLP